MNIRIWVLGAAFASLSVLTACNHYSLEERAEKEADEFTAKYCPTPINNMQRTDSIVFDRATHTFSYYYSLVGAADNIEAINKVRAVIRKALLDDLVNNTGNKAYKEAGYGYRYVFHSGKTKQVLFEEKLSKKDYQ